MQTKVCKKCGEEKQATNEYFRESKKGKYGFRSDCKLCERKYRESHRQQENEQKRQYYEENKYKKKEYYKNNKSKIRKRHKDYYNINRDKLIEYHKQYYENNKEKIKEETEQYRKINNVKRKQYYNENKERIKEERKQYRIINLEKERLLGNLRQHKRLALKKQLPYTLTIEQWNKCKKYFNNKCAYCGEERELAQEHFIPLSKCGEYTHNNIIPSCISCNSSKKDRDFFEWYSKQEFYSKDKERKILKYLNYDAKTKIQQLALSI